MAVPLFDLTRQYQQMKAEIDEAALSVLASGQFILGKRVQEFEAQAAAYCGTRFAVGVASGTDALILTMKALGVGPGDEVITSPFTFIATAECISHHGAKPVFVDIEADTFNLDPAQVAQAVTPRTKAILPVHLFGHAAAMDDLQAIADQHRLAVVEDAAQAWGAEYHGRKAGGIGTAGCFSFFPTKNLACAGDGGLVTTNDEQLAERLHMLRGHGASQRYLHPILGYNSRLDALQAALLSVKLRYVDGFNEARRRNAQRYRELFAGTPVAAPAERDYAMHVYHQYTVRLPDRDKVVEALRQANIGCMIYYPVALHQQPAFACLGYKEGDFPVTEQACREVLSLPVFPELTEAEMEEVAAVVKAAVQRSKG